MVNAEYFDEEDITPHPGNKKCDDCGEEMLWWNSPDDDFDPWSGYLCRICIRKAEDGEIEVGYDIQDAEWGFDLGAWRSGCLVYLPSGERESPPGTWGRPILCDDCKDSGYCENDGERRLCECEVGEFATKFEENQRKWSEMKRE